MIPDDRGYFGGYGGRFVPETLMSALEELAEAYAAIRQDPDFHREFEHYLQHYVGRPSPLYHAASLSRHIGGAQIYLKREDLNHTGAHKINNTLGQALLAKKMGKNRIIAETGAGQHGVATATVAALFGFKATVFMGAEDVRRQKPNVFRMQLLGAEIIEVTNGSQTLKDAMNEAIRDWVSNVEETYYLIGSVAGPHPYPQMVKEFQSVIGREARQQYFELRGKLPEYVIACVGGGSNAMGIFSEFIPETTVQLIGVEAGGFGTSAGQHAATLTRGRPGVLHGSLSYLLQDEDGQIAPVHSVSAGLDYPGVGPELSYLKDAGRICITTAGDQEALEALKTLCEKEGILPALESAHAVHAAITLAASLPEEESIIVNLSGRGDKDVDTILAEEEG